MSIAGHRLRTGAVLAILRQRGDIGRARAVAPFNGKPVQRMLNGAWLRARARAELTQVRVHGLKHTFWRRLRASGVSFEDRQDLLGHRSTRMTTHYSAPELSRLFKSANQVCERKGTKPQLVMLRRRSAA